MMKTFYSVFLVLFLSKSLVGQVIQSSRNGHSIPTQTTLAKPLRVLMAFVEFDASGGNCTGVNNSCWQSGARPDGLPFDVEDYFDPIPSNSPVAYFSKYFYEASFGKFIVVGDYLKNVVRVPCSALGNTYPIDYSAINTAIHNEFITNGTAHNLPISAFDNYTTASGMEGLLKPDVPDNNIDFLIILYANSRNNNLCGVGHGCGNNTITSGFIIDGYGINTSCDFFMCGTPLAKDFILEEFFHALFGSNHFHSGVGASYHTFPWRTQPWGMSTQIGGAGVSLVPCGWDRWWLGWEPDTDNEIIEAHDENNTNDISSDISMPIQGSSLSSDFWLRDFVQTGDAIRIKLPYINGEISGERPQKKQYLWLENHKKISQFDHSVKYIYTQSSCNPIALCGTDIGDGIWATVQVGKDSIAGYNIYSASPLSASNSLASWMFPLFANGYFDQDYGPFTNYNQSNPVCSRNSISNDFVSTGNQSNAFSGYCPIYGLPNTNGDDLINYNPAPYTGTLRPPDLIQGCATLNGGNIEFDLKILGCEEMSFKCDNGSGCPVSGKEILSLCTNPAPFGVLTRRSGDNYSLPVLTPNEPFENRAIWLSGLSISILEENPFTNDVKLRVRWDDFDVSNDVRWCADSIFLSPNPFDINSPSLIINNNATVLIDRGKSPTQETAVEQISNEYIFTNKTIFTSKSGAIIRIAQGSKLIVDNGSYLNLESESSIIVEDGAELIIRNGSVLNLYKGSSILVAGTGKVLVKDNSVLNYFENSKIELAGSNSLLELEGNLNIIAPAKFETMQSNGISGHVVFSNRNNPSDNVHCIGGNCSINLNGVGQGIDYIHVNQDGLYLGAGFTSVNISNCKVRLKQDASIEVSCPSCQIDIHNAKFTSAVNGSNNLHNGLKLFGQGNILLSSSVFEYGKYGIQTNNSVYGNSLNVYNCTFRNNLIALKGFDKAVNLFNCNMFNNEFGALCTYMSYPSYVHQGLYGGSTILSNNVGISWYGAGFANLELRDPFINNNEVGLVAKGVPLTVGCGTISYNKTGISLIRGSSLFMDDLAFSPVESKVSVFNNENSIVLSDALLLSMNKGYNNLQSSIDAQGKVVNGTILPGGPNPIIANCNHWNISGSISASDYNINSNSIVFQDGAPLISAITCGQATPPCPAPPCTAFSSPLDYCPECELINTDDFISIKLNEAVQKAIDDLLSNQITKEVAADQLAQVLLEQFDSLSNKEIYVLDVTYLKMLEFAAKYIEQEKDGDLDSGNVILSKFGRVINAIGAQKQKNMQFEFYSRAFLNWLHEAQLYRMLGRRDIALSVLNEVPIALLSEEESSQLTEFVCILMVEKEFHDGSISLIEFENEIDLCSESKNNSMRRVPGHDDHEENISELSNIKDLWYISPTPIFTNSFNVQTILNNYNINIYNTLGEVVYSKFASGSVNVNISDRASGLYLIEMVHAASGKSSRYRMLKNK